MAGKKGMGLGLTKIQHLNYCIDCHSKIAKDKIIKPAVLWRVVNTDRHCRECHKLLPRGTDIMRFYIGDLKEDFLIKCRVCGLEAHTQADLELFRNHWTGDKRLKKFPRSYPFGKERICLNCYRKRNNSGNRDKEASRKAVAEWVRNSPHKHKAIAYSFQHLKVGDTCALCGAKDVPLQKHHPDYRRPDFVVTLCCSCHHKLHKVKPFSKNRENKNLCEKCANLHTENDISRCSAHCDKIFDGINMWIRQKKCKYFKPICIAP